MINLDRLETDHAFYMMAANLDPEGERLLEAVPVLLAEVRRLREALQQIADASLTGWDDGGALASRCQAIARATLEKQKG